jgi:hypothetical protein
MTCQWSRRDVFSVGCCRACSGGWFATCYNAWCNFQSAPASNAHGNAVALKGYSMLSSDGLETMEDEEQSESDVEMETQGERGRTYMNS